MRLCKCGCGNSITEKSFQKYYPKPVEYINGHYYRNRKRYNVPWNKDKKLESVSKFMKEWWKNNQNSEKGQKAIKTLIEKGQRRKLTDDDKRKIREGYTDEVKKKMEEKRKKLIDSGRKPPCTGKTKENYEPLRRISDYMKKGGALKARKGNLPKPNNPEKVLKEIIEKNNLPFNYVGDGKIWFKGENHSFNPDFLSKNPKHIIEVFGDYWHRNTQEKDKERLETYSKYGYKTFIVWEHELMRNKGCEKLMDTEIANKIREFANSS